MMKEKGINVSWTIGEIKQAIQFFFEKFARYPTTLDFDRVNFLPSSRYVQRNLGGIIKLRLLLNIDGPADYTKGEYRSKIASKMYGDASDYENIFYFYLTSKIPEIRIHEHKILRPGRVCCDFFIYKSDKDGIAMDLFYAQDIYSLSRIINIKQKRYDQLTNIPVYLILVKNKNITQKEIDKLVYNKKTQLSKQIKVIDESYFRENIMPTLVGDKK